MNRAILIGNLTNNCELRYTTSNKAVASFSLAINNGKDREADFINCEVWNIQAENLSKYTQKGDMIAVEGSIKTDTYEKDGQKRYRTYVLASRIQFLKTKKEKTPEQMFEPIKNEIGNDLPVDELPW